MRSQLTLRRSRDLVQLPNVCDQRCVLALARMHRTKLCKVCAPLDVPPTLELSANSEVVLELPRSFHCCFVLVICNLRRRLSGCSFMGCLCSSYHMGCCYQWIQPRTHSLARRLASDFVPSSSNFGFVSLTFHPQLFCATSSSIHNASIFPGEQHLRTCLCESRHSR